MTDPVENATELDDETTDQEKKPGQLVDWANPPTLANLKQHLEDARPTHTTQAAVIDSYLDNLHVRNSAKIIPKKNRSSIQPKLIRKQAEWRYAALSEPFLSTDDVFNVKPVSWEDKGAAVQNELVLNHQMNTCIDKVTFIDKYVRTAVDEGTVIVKVGWEEKEEDYIEEGPAIEYIVDTTFGPTIEMLAQMKAQDPQSFKVEIPFELKEALRLSGPTQQGQPVRPQIIGYGPQQRTRTVYNRPTLEIMDYRNVIMDPTAKGDYTKATFFVVSYETSKSKLKEDGRYQNLEQIQANQNSPLNEPDHNSGRAVDNFNFADPARTKIVVYEYWGNWDIDGNGTVKPIMAAWCGNVLLRMEENPFPDKGLPFVVVQYLPVRNANYGEPDGALLEDNQKILGAVTRGMIDLMGKSANGQRGMRKDMLDATNKRKFENGDDYEYNGGIDPRVGTFTHEYPEIPNSALTMLGLQNQEAESLTGVRSFSQGVSGNSLGDVAAGVRGALDAASKRELGILRRLSAGMVAIGRKLIAMNAEWLSEEEVVRVTNEDFVTVRRDDLPGNFDLRLSISTAEEDDNKARELAFMLQTMGNNMDPSMSRMILADIAKLRKMPDLAKRIETYEPTPDPMQQKMQELEMAKLEVEVAKLQAEANKIRVEAGLAEAKIGTEYAKQGQLASQTDQANLDFVEQESGVTQERELQQHGAQAEAQTKMVLIKGYMDERKEKIKAAKKPKAA